VGNDRLQAKGKIENAVGTAQAGMGDLKSDLKKKMK
jgi:uncharacterized protein YjbJ (UPF0337 family)